MQSVAIYDGCIGFGAAISSSWGISEVIPPFGRKSSEEMMDLIARRYHGALIDKGEANAAAKQLAAYFRGELQVFSVPLDLRHLSPFAAAVCRAVMAIPYGEVRSYGQIAVEAGYRGSARGVGSVMAANRIPIIIPCHRVVAADGSMCGYSAEGGIATKIKLLEMEGVRLT